MASPGKPGGESQKSIASPAARTRSNTAALQEFALTQSVAIVNYRDAPRNAAEAPDERFAPGEPVSRAGDEIVICGRLFHTGTRVVTWLDRGGYNGYQCQNFFPGTSAAAEDVPGARFGCRRLPPKKRASLDVPRYPSERLKIAGGATDGASMPSVVEVRSSEWDVDMLAGVVSQVVLHYDECGTARRCFRTLHDERRLSCHFVIDVDGVVYQTLDLKERAWHATTANDRSVGVEICNVGAYTAEELALRGGDPLVTWYPPDAGPGGGVRLAIPPEFDGDRGVATRGFGGRPARSEVIVGEIQGLKLRQYDFTAPQYGAVVKLLAALVVVLPQIAVVCPRDPGGGVAAAKLGESALAAFRGILGHFHVQANKRDPGPAFQWDATLAAVAARVGARRQPGGGTPVTPSVIIAEPRLSASCNGSRLSRSFSDAGGPMGSHGEPGHHHASSRSVGGGADGSSLS